MSKWLKKIIVLTGFVNKKIPTIKNGRDLQTKRKTNFIESYKKSL